MPTLRAIAMAREFLEQQEEMPEHGLVVYCGVLGENREERFSFEPPLNLSFSLYLMDKRFHVDCVLGRLSGPE